MRRGLAFEGSVHRQHDLVDPAGLDAGDEGVDRQVFGENAFERGQATAEDVEPAREQARAFKRP